MRSLLVTGTDTGVGKTVVACAIIRALREEGLDVGVYKPVETGCELRDGRLVGADCKRLREAAGGGQPLESVASYLFEQAAAPLVAASAEGVRIDPSKLERDFRALASRHDFMVVEGAGGLLVPIAKDLSYLDLANSLALPVLVVVGSRLGCINHALLTTSALVHGGVHCVGTVVNCLDEIRSGPASPEQNRTVIAALSGVPDLGLFPRIGKGDCPPFPILGKIDPAISARPRGQRREQ